MTSIRSAVRGNASALGARTIGPRLADFMLWRWERQEPLEPASLRAQFPALTMAEVHRAIEAFTGCIAGGCTAEEMRVAVSNALGRPRPNERTAPMTRTGRKTSRRAPLRKTSRRNPVPVMISMPKDPAGLEHYLRVAYPVGEWVRFVKSVEVDFGDINTKIPLDARAEIIEHIPGKYPPGGPAITVRFPDVSSYVFAQWAKDLRNREMEIVGVDELSAVEVLGAVAPNMRRTSRGAGRERPNPLCIECRDGVCTVHEVPNPAPPPPEYRTAGPRGSLHGGTVFERWVERTYAPGTRVRVTRAFTPLGRGSSVVLPVGMLGTVQGVTRGAIDVRFEAPPDIDSRPRSEQLEVERALGGRSGVHQVPFLDLGAASVLEALDDNWGALVTHPLGRHHLPRVQRSWLKPNEP